MSVAAVLFDFGGVLADEGFKHGLHAIARANGLEPEAFEALVEELIFSTGYLTGGASEADFWHDVRRATGIRAEDAALKRMILERFTLRPWMIDIVKGLKGRVKLAILSDQTNWLDELDAGLHFFELFDYVFNSYHLGKSKRDPSLFDDVLAVMGIAPEKALFIDDRPGNVARAGSRGLRTMLYNGRDDFLGRLAEALA